MSDKSLNDMPKSSDDVWEHAEINLRKMEDKLAHEHKFVQLTSREIRCECGFGLYIGVDDCVKADGHLYHDNVFVV